MAVRPPGSGVAPAGAGAASAQAREPVFLPSGVADPAAMTGYVADAGGIVAVALDRGSVLWRSDAADRPLIVVGDGLAAAAGAEVVLIANGRVVLRTALPDPPVAPPTWMSAHADPPRLVVAWRARSGYRGGAAPTEAILERATVAASGTAVIDLDSGAVTAAESVDDGVLRPPIDADVGEDPWEAGGRTARLRWRVAGREQELALETAAGTRTLLRGSGLVAAVARDGRHVFARAHDEARWQSFSAATGEPVARITCAPGAHAPVILGERAYQLADAGGRTALTARALATDVLAWELTLGERETTAAPRPRQ